MADPTSTAQLKPGPTRQSLLPIQGGDLTKLCKALIGSESTFGNALASLHDANDNVPGSLAMLEAQIGKPPSWAKVLEAGIPFLGQKEVTYGHLIDVLTGQSRENVEKLVQPVQPPAHHGGRAADGSPAPSPSSEVETRSTARPVVIACALDEELEAVVDAFHEAGMAMEEDVDGQSYSFYHVTIQLRTGVSVRVIAIAFYNMGAIATGNHIRRIVDEFNPRLVLMPGVCAGRPADPDKPGKPDVQIRDLVVADRVFELSGKEDGNGKKYDISSINVEDFLLGRLASINKAAKARIASAGIARADESAINVVRGHIASSSSFVVGNLTPQMWVDLASTTGERKLLALEMEGAALFQAIASHNERVERGDRISVMMAKGVMDNASPDKTDSDKATAAKVSAIWTTCVVQDSLLFKALGYKPSSEGSAATTTTTSSS